jgi:hypothetical protein
MANRLSFATVNQVCAHWGVTLVSRCRRELLSAPVCLEPFSHLVAERYFQWRSSEMGSSHHGPAAPALTVKSTHWQEALICCQDSC